MKLGKLLAALVKKRVQIRAESGELRIRAPKGALDSVLREAIRTQKEGLLAFIGEGYALAPASFSQLRLWLIEELQPGTAAYNMLSSLRLRGPLDQDVLQRVFDEIVRRQESLRTSFIAVEGAPLQRIAPPFSMPIESIDLRGYGQEALSRAKVVVEERVHRSFDLSKSPLMRLYLLQLGEEDYVFAFVTHHAVSDGWSNFVLTQEIMALYGAFSQGKASPLSALPLSYADFACRQQGWYAEEREADLAYWRQQLSGPLPVLDLPRDRARPAVHSYRGAVCRRPFPDALKRRLTALAREEGATLFMALLSAFNVLLYRYTGQEDIVVGTSIAGREQEDTEKLVGFFVNALALRTSVVGSLSTRELLRRGRKVVLEAQKHQSLPFGKLVEAIAPARSLSHSPIFQVMLVLHNYAGELPKLPGLSLEWMPVPMGRSLFDLTISVGEVLGKPEIAFEYDTDQFETATIERMMGHYFRVLEGMVADADATIASLPLLTAAESHQLLVAWNDTATPYPKTCCLHDLLDESVARWPEAIAVRFGEASLSYAALGARANQVAHFLREQGVRRESLVGVCMARSLELLPVLYGVMKSGGAYVPIDPAYPKERIAFMLEDAAAPVIISQAALEERLPPYPGVLLVVDSQWGALADYPKHDPESVSSPEDLAYVMYTSGSTGTPKGAMILHRGLVNYLSWAQSNYVHEGQGTVVHSSVSFDLTVTELYTAVLSGKTVRLAPEMTHVGELLHFLREQEDLSLLKLTPAHLNALGTELSESVLAALAPVLVVGGEQLYGDYVRRWRAARPDIRIVNEYGPTETVVGCCVYDAPETIPDIIPIGRPIANTQLYVLDERLQPTPVGVPGELYIGGEGVGRGYYNRPELTAHHFVPDIFSEEPGRLLYRTGDRAQYRSDGVLVFLGRNDGQVKVRGYRIELEEIASALKAHDAVLDALVLLREDSPGDKRLAGYCVPALAEEKEAAFGAASSTQVAQWQALYDDTFSADVRSFAPGENFLGWDSSYTGAAIPLEEMQAWLGDTVAALQAFSPAHMLEIGCGSGLILARMAPDCLAYWATDFSDSVLKHTRQLASEGVSLFHRPAHDFSGFPKARFDLVLVNSVAQYFPSAGYLEGVIREAVKRVAPGGVMYLGDVRSLALLESYALSVEAYRASAETDAESVRRAVAQRIEREEELLLDPAFFMQLGEEVAEISHVSIHPKCARYTNELSKFRYEVVLHVGAKPTPVRPENCLNWEDSLGRLEDLENLLASGERELLALLDVPRGLLTPEWEMALRLEEGNGAAALKACFNGGLQGISPAEFKEIGKAWGYKVELDWRDHLRDSYHVIFYRGDWSGRIPALPVSSYIRKKEGIANTPLCAGLRAKLPGVLRAYLADALPEYMLPSAIMILDAFPLTENGKVDRRALPAPKHSQREGKAHVAPRNRVEEKLAEIWEALLGVEGIGVTEDFFALGGHSLLATQVMSRVREAFSTNAPLRVLFEAPTIAGLAQRIVATARVETGKIKAYSGEDETGYPLSFAQQRLWFVEALTPGNRVYLSPAVLRFKGKLDADILRRVFQEIVDRHQVLQTRIREEAGEVRQYLVREKVRLEQEDFSVLSPSEKKAGIDAIYAAIFQRPFALGSEAPFRISLIRLGEEESLVLLALHHIVSDGWSTGILIEEVMALYPAFETGQPSPLPTLPIQYFDYARWQRGYLQGTVLADHVIYWRERLEGAPVLALPTDAPRPAIQDYAGAIERIRIPSTLRDALLKLGKEEGATLFITLLTAFKVLLMRYAGQSDIVVGTPIANRNKAELEGLIGFFVNMLVLRTQFAAGLSFRQALARVRETALGAYEHQDLPFEQLVDALAPERDLSRNLLFQVSFALQNTPAPEFRLPGLEIFPETYEAGVTRFDLGLHVWESGAGLDCVATYRVDLFEGATIRRMLKHWLHLLAEIVQSPEADIFRVPLLDETELYRILVEWNSQEASYPVDFGVHSLLEAQAEKDPEAVALRGEFGTVRYGELNRRANHMAQCLLDRGVKREEVIGVCFSRSVEMVAALYGIFKAGCAYLPLDPKQPVERLRFMMADADLRTVMTTKRLAEQLPAFSGSVLIAEGNGAAANPEVSVSGKDLAYVIYTSGSTGQPKGVMIEHGSVLNRLYGMQDAYALDRSDRILHKTSYTFDVSVWELFWPALSGSEIVLARPGDEGDGNYLAETIRSYEVTTCHFVPSMLGYFLEAREACDCVSLKRVLTGGEPLSLNLQERFFATLEAELHHLYGPTEATIDVTAGACVSGSTEAAASIGRPAPNATIYILDEHQSPVPVGVAGEVYIGGAQVARGYLKRPDLTEEAFVTNPFVEGTRLYRSGDRARYLSDGRIVFLGRVDDQVKVRGNRIELGEISAHLLKHEAIAEAITVLREDRPGDQRIVAYYIPVSEEGVAPAELRASLSRQLPEYMLPSFYVALSSWPRLSTGKVDKRALAAPEANRVSSEVAYVPPRTARETHLAALWREFLSLDQVGVEDNFFHVGGHSLLAMRLVGRIRDELGVQIALRDFFGAPTVASLAQLVDVTQAHEVVPIKPRKRGSSAPLSYAQERLWFLEQLTPGAGAYHMSTGIRIDGKLEAAALAQAVAALAQRHEILRTRFVMEGEGAVQVADSPVEDIFEVLDWREREGAPEAALTFLAAQGRQVFDLSQGPLFRVSLLRLAEERSVLFVGLHHIVADGWSMAILIEDLITLYSEGLAGIESSGLAPLEIHYADFAVWQREQLQGERLGRLLGYWEERLVGAETLNLAADFPRDPAGAYQGESVQCVISEEQCAALKRLVDQAGATLFMGLTAVLKVLLHRWSGQEDIVVGTPVAGRDYQEIEASIGLFLNTVVLRTSLADSPSFLEVLDRVRAGALEAFEHQELPFEKLVEALAPEREMSRMPLFQVMIVFQNIPRTPLAAPGLSITPMPLEGGAPKVDLNFHLEEVGGALRLNLQYDAGLFQERTAQQMLAHFQAILKAAAAAPETAIGALPMLSEEEQCRVYAPELERCARRDRVREDFATRGVSIGEVFSEQARRYGDHIAVRSPEASCSYSELEAASNRVAQCLHALGTRVSDRVGLYFNAGIPQLAALLGVLKAGKAYVPLDPVYPDARLAFMVEDAGLEIVLTEGVARPAFVGEKLFCLPYRNTQGFSGPAQELPKVPAEALAYILYTSGSTGNPKGVMQSHRNVLHHIEAYTRDLGIDARDRLTLFSSFGFDAAVMDIFGALLNGATLYPIRLREMTVDRVADWIASEHLTIFHATPSAYRAILESQPKEGVFPDVAIVALGGEPTRRDDVVLFRRHFPAEAVFVNLLGPTESTVTLRHFIHAGTSVPHGAPAVGRPALDTEIMLVDHMGHPGQVVGEIVVRSPYVALGYWQRPALTADAFEEGAGAGQARLYRMGDLGRLLPDGTIQFLGRRDSQIKVRGYRIELTEIETVLKAHAAVRQALVIVDAQVQESRLVGYVALRVGHRVSSEELRTLLRDRLPDYMVPVAFIILEALPLTPNGKVDRRMLPQVDWASEAEELLSPRNPVEEMLASLWMELLSLPSVGVGDDFFALGGHSLLATRLISRVRQLFEVELSLRTFFAAPTIADLAKEIERLRSSGASVRLPELLPVDRVANPYLPLSFSQQRLWVIEQLHPGGAAYHLPMAMRLRGPLDFEALEKSIAFLVERHEILRTTVGLHEGDPYQCITRDAHCPVLQVDLRVMGEAGLHNALKEKILPSFSLAEGPLIRTILYQLGDEDHVFLCVVHHLVSDAWSRGVLVAELSTLYTAIHAGEKPCLPPLSIQYADYAQWQRRCLAGARMRRLIDYWKERLAGLSPLAFPTDYARNAQGSSRGGREYFSLPDSLREKLLAFSQAEQSTLFMILLAGFKALLYRYTMQEDLAVGTPVANRRHPATESLIGFFVNTLVLRTQMGGAPSFRDLLQRVRATSLAAFDHQDIPFEKIVEALHPERDVGRNPLFDVMFSFRNTPLATMSLPGLRVRGVDLALESTQFDLAMDLMDRDGVLSGRIAYRRDLFEQATILRMQRHFVVLLEQALSDPDQSIGALSMLSVEERQQVLVEWGPQEVAYPGPWSLHECFEAQVARSPEATALVYEGELVSYAALNRRANRIACYLREQGVGADSLVAVCMDRSVAMYVAIYGVLKSGGAYVPLDAAYPEARLRCILEDTSSAIVLTQASLQPRFAGMAVEVAVVDDEASAFSCYGEANASVAVRPESLAYVLYTSGSTGKPKGVMVSHRAICNFTHWRKSYFPLAEGDTAIMKRAISFDASLISLFCPLQSGARVVIVPPDRHMETAYVAQLMRKWELSILDDFPSMLSALLEEEDFQRCASLKWVTVGGEALPKAVRDRFHRHMKAALFNCYGPTEAAVEVSLWACEREGEGSCIPIGRSVPNVSLMILDAQGELLPVGIPGELCVGGAQVARGYWGAAALTAERFIPNPFDAEAEALIYRTGDLARYLPNGAIEFLGRMDHQVKIRGHRVELGEIESALGACAGVDEVVVLLKERKGGRQYLVAYVTPEGDGALREEALEDFLQERLPSYMRPSHFVVMDSMPRLVNGKVDRHALPEPIWESRSRAIVREPGNRAEEILAEIFRRLLALESVGVEESFFALGGDSIVAIQLVAQARKAGLYFAPRDVFVHQTIAALAAHACLEEEEEEAGPVFGAVALTPIQHHFFSLSMEKPAHFNQGILVKLVRPVPEAILREASVQLLQHHDALRLRFRKEGGVWRQHYGEEGSEAFSVLDLSSLSPSEEAAAIRDATAGIQERFNLTAGPLFQVALIHLGGGGARLFLAAHHLVVDGVSWRILLEDFQELVSQQLDGGTAALPPKTASYQQWSAALQRYAHSSDLLSELPYWREVQGGAALPVDFTEEDANRVERSCVYTVSLEQRETDYLLHTAPGQYRADVQEILLAALARAFQVWTGQDSVCLDMESHGREGVSEALDLSRTVGWFTAIYPLKVHLEGAVSALDCLKRAKEDLRAVPKKGLGFGVLRYLNTDAGALGGEGMPEICFNYLGQFDGLFPADGLVAPAKEALAPTRDPAMKRPYLLEISARVLRGRLQMSWRYGSRVHCEATIGGVAEDCMRTLRVLLQAPKAEDKPVFSPSDFKGARLSQQSLDRFMSKLNKKGSD